MNLSDKLRPLTLKQFVGKKNIVKSLSVGIKVAKKTFSTLDHILLYGPAGVGKTSLAQIVANEMSSSIKIVQAINIQTLSDLIGILSTIRNGDIFFLDEIHTLKKEISEVLYPVLEDNVLDIVIGKNMQKRAIRMKLPKFTFIAATTNLGKINKSLEERFGYIFFLELYKYDELFEIIKQTAEYLGLSLSQDEIVEIISNSRGVPRNCNRILKRIKDYKIIDEKAAVSKVVRECGYLYKGLTEIDIKYLLALFKSENYCASIVSVSQATNLDEKTLIFKVEPFLYSAGFIIKFNKGRKLTMQGMNIINEFNVFNRANNLN